MSILVNDVSFELNDDEIIKLNIPDGTFFVVGPVKKNGVHQVMPSMIEVIKRIRTHANGEDPVFLSGESGTGKDVFAKIIHCNSPRMNGPFININCTGPEKGIFESVFFGSTRGIYTDAVERSGIFEDVKGGTLFLNEIGDIPLDIQPKLLTVLESKQGSRVGSTDIRKYDFRLICATHKNINKMVKDGTFRDDLRNRICGLDIMLPPISERRDHILYIAEALLLKYNKNNKKNITFSDEFKEALQRMRWIPGNMRGIDNFIINCAINCQHGSVITMGNAVEVNPFFGTYPDHPLSNYCINLAKKLTRDITDDASVYEIIGLSIASALLFDGAMYKAASKNDKSINMMIELLINNSKDLNYLCEIERLVEQCISSRRDKYINDNFSKKNQGEIGSALGKNQTWVSRRMSELNLKGVK